MPLRGRTGAPTLAAIHRPRGRASRLAQASRERLRAMRRGRRGKSPVTFPGTTPRQKDAHAASPDGRRKARRRGRLRRSSVARPASSQAVPRGACAAVRTVDGQRRRGGSGPRAANVSISRERRGRPPLAPPSPPRAPPYPPAPRYGLTRLRRSDGVFLPDGQALGTLADGIDRPSSRLRRRVVPPPRRETHHAPPPGQKNNLRSEGKRKSARFHSTRGGRGGFCRRAFRADTAPLGHSGAHDGVLRGARRKRLAGRRLEEASACPAAKPPKSLNSSARRIMRPHAARPSALRFARCSRTCSGVRKARRASGGGAPLHATTPSAAVHGRARQAPLLRRQATAPPRPAFL